MGRTRSNLVISRGGWALRDGQFPEMAAMTNTRKILIVDDDAELRDAMVEQLALHEEFESVAVDSGTKGVRAAAPATPSSLFLVTMTTSFGRPGRSAPSVIAWFDLRPSISVASSATPASSLSRAHPRAILQVEPSDLTSPSTRLIVLLSTPRSLSKTAISSDSSITLRAPLVSGVRAGARCS